MSGAIANAPIQKPAAKSVSKQGVDTSPDSFQRDSLELNADTASVVDRGALRKSLMNAASTTIAVGAGIFRVGKGVMGGVSEIGQSMAIGWLKQDHLSLPGKATSENKEGEKDTPTPDSIQTDSDTAQPDEETRHNAQKREEEELPAFDDNLLQTYEATTADGHSLSEAVEAATISITTSDILSADDTSATGAPAADRDIEKLLETVSYTTE